MIAAAEHPLVCPKCGSNTLELRDLCWAYSQISPATIDEKGIVSYSQILETHTNYEDAERSQLFCFDCDALVAEQLPTRVNDATIVMAWQLTGGAKLPEEREALIYRNLPGGPDPSAEDLFAFEELRREAGLAYSETASLLSALKRVRTIRAAHESGTPARNFINQLLQIFARH